MEENIQTETNTTPKDEIPDNMEDEMAATISPLKQPVLIAQRSEFSGPLPPPEILTEYEQIYPGAAKIIFKMAGEQAQHRQHMEKRSLDLAGRDSMLGILSGFIIALSGIIGGIMLISFHPDSVPIALSGAVISGSSLVGIIRTFVVGSKKEKNKKQEQEEKS